jgi:hypothetical protein
MMINRRNRKEKLTENLVAVQLRPSVLIENFVLTCVITCDISADSGKVLSWNHATSCDSSH